MKTVMKNVLLGSVAGFAMVGTAAAADLPVKAKAAEYVKICSTYGAGFYYVPGTDTCLKVGGYVTADTYVMDYDYKIKDAAGREYFIGGNFGDTETYFKTRGAIQLDARTQTEYGTLRSYIEARFEYGEAYGVSNLDSGQTGYSGGSISDVYLKYGYIQFAGFTFGRATSAFDFWAGDFYYGIDPGSFYSDTTANVIQYTADFGNGFSATIALEDAYARESAASVDYYFAEPQQVPDIVANIAYEGTWGAAKLSAAFHDLRSAGDTYNTSDDYGWAILAGVRFDFAETTTLYIEGAYADGAAGYLGLSSFLPNSDFDGNGVSGWYAGGALQHYWTPTVFTSLVGNYTASDSFATDVAFAPDGAGVGLGYVTDVDFSGYNVGVNIGWQPVKGLTIVAQYDYLEYEYDYDTLFATDLSSEEYTQNRFTLSVRRSF